MKYRIVVHLKDGSAVAGKITEIDQSEVDEVKDALQDQLRSKPIDGWQVSIESDNGTWGIFPKDSVLWIELERIKDNGN